MLHTATLLGPSSVPTGCSHMGQLVLCPGVGRGVCVWGGGFCVAGCNGVLTGHVDGVVVVRAFFPRGVHR